VTHPERPSSDHGSIGEMTLRKFQTEIRAYFGREDLWKRSNSLPLSSVGAVRLVAFVLILSYGRPSWVTR
jgi:hypothetical protein